MSLKKIVYLILSLFSAKIFALCPNAVCTLNATSSNFGAYYPTKVPVITTVNTITATCQSGLPLTLCSLVLGINGGMSSNYNPRRMFGPKNTNLTYNLYTSSAYDAIFGNGTSGTLTQTGSCTSKQTRAPYSCTMTFTVYGKIAGSSPTAIVGAYNDSITATAKY